MAAGPSWKPQAEPNPQGWVVCPGSQVAGREPTKVMGRRAVFYAFLGNFSGQVGKEMSLGNSKRLEKPLEMI